MKKKRTRLTTAQFAKLHGVNKRTLHYYDSIGLFSPQEKGENGYRYYDTAQSMEFEYLRMLKELHMSIEEIQEYRKHPSAEAFIEMAQEKERELEEEITKLRHMKAVLKRRKEQIAFCEQLQEQEIRIVSCEEEKLLILDWNFWEEEVDSMFSEAKAVWNMEQIRMGIGDFISLEKVKAGRFSEYDGLYTPAVDKKSKGKSMVKPAGRYLCGYQRGKWERLPEVYEKMLAYAKTHGLELTGYIYEMGLNEFVIQKPEDYMTQVMILIREKSNEM